MDKAEFDNLAIVDKKAFDPAKAHSAGTSTLFAGARQYSSSAYLAGHIAALDSLGLKSEETQKLAKIARQLPPKMRSMLYQKVTQYGDIKRALDDMRGFTRQKIQQMKDEELELWAEELSLTIDDIEKTPRLERPAQSLFHTLMQDITSDEDGKVFAEEKGLLKDEAHVFLVQHDWASAFKAAQDFDGGEIKLPYDICIFEFAISGQRICAIFVEDDGVRFTFALKLKGHWFFPNPVMRLTRQFRRDVQVNGPDLVDLLIANVRAICISLDAEIVETEIERAPYKLNAKRERLGKIPIYDYRRLSLVNRKRAALLPEHEPAERRSPRLHFRRGHWRHYQNHKTWIRWQLVGNPDFGFIDKEYRL